MNAPAEEPPAAPPAHHPAERAPRWLPLAVMLVIFTASLLLYLALVDKQNQEIAQTVKAGADSASNQIAIRTESRIRSLLRMAKRWEFSGTPSQAAWQDDASNYVNDLPDSQALEWIDATDHLPWAAALHASKVKLEINLSSQQQCKAAMDKARQQNRPILTPILAIAPGEFGFVIYVPVTVSGRFDGFMAAAIDTQSCLDRYLPPAIADGEAIALSDGGQDFYARAAGSPPGPRDWTVTENVDLPGAAWEMRVWPTPALAERLDSPLPQVVLFAGILGSILLGAVFYLALRFARQAADMARANTSLRTALEQVKTLEGLLPICSYCKRVRDDTGYWSQIDNYLRKHTNASLSHSYCPECAAKMYQEWGIEVPESVQADIDAGNYD